MSSRTSSGASCVRNWCHSLCCPGKSFFGEVSRLAKATFCSVERVVPAGHGAETQIRQLLWQAGRADSGYRLLDASRGGYARVDHSLAAFIDEMDQDGRLPVEACYTGKALLALRQYVQRGYFPPRTRLVMLHSGGLPGARALPAGARQGCNPQDAPEA